MKNNDWREKLGELSFMKGYYFKLEDNGLVEKKDDQLVFNREELEHFIEEELDKAKIEVLTEIFQTCYQEDSKTRELVEEKLAKLRQ